MPPDLSRLRGRIGRLLIAGLVALPLGCGPFHREPEEDARLVFTNDCPDQAHVYAAGANGHQVRIGVVLGLRVETLRVPAVVISQGGSIKVSARIVDYAGGAVSSEPFPLSAGDTVRVRLTSDKQAILIVAGHRN